MEFAVVKGELCSCSCNFVSSRVENRGEKRQMTKKRSAEIQVCSCTCNWAWAKMKNSWWTTKKGRQKFW